MDESMEKRIQDIKESDCEFVEAVNTRSSELPVVEMSRKLAKIAQSAVAEILGQHDPVFAGELLLLAGYNTLLFTQDKKLTNMAVHFTGLKMDGEELPIQSVYIAMKKTAGKKSVPSGRTTLKHRGRKKQEAVESVEEKPAQKTEGKPTWAEMKAVQAKLDSSTPKEVLDAAEEYRVSESRMGGMPSLRDTPLTEEVPYIPMGTMVPSVMPSGLRGVMGA